MRTSWLSLSLLFHGGLVGALCWHANGVAAAPRPVPRVELQASEAHPPAPPPAALAPEVVVEAVRDDRQASEPAEVVEPWLPPAVAPAPPLGPHRELPKEHNPKVRMTLPTVPPPPEPAPEPAPLVPPSLPSVHTEATPLADNQPPDYPAADRAAGREGTVVVTVHLDPAGQVLGVELREPSPYPGLNRAALRAVAGWRFRPATRDGAPVEGLLDVPVVFRLLDR